jgi:tetraacyldisaccharide 4'-kinase
MNDVYSGFMRALLLLYSPFSRWICGAKRALYSRGRRKAARAPLPVISVGNVSFGGTGKTPTAMEIISLLIRLGWKPALVSRGYRGNWERNGGVLSDGRRIFASWREGGDEPFMVARRFPEAGVLVGRDRLASCRKALELGFDIVVLDDGFQHLRLHRDLDIVLLDPRDRGPLRESLSAVTRAGIVLLAGKSITGGGGLLKPPLPDTSIFTVRTRAEGCVDLRTGEIAPFDDMRKKKIVAFAGIAAPHRFFGLLRESGAEIAAEISFPDHHAFPEKSLLRIASRLEETGAEAAVTTEKDSVKIPASGTVLDSHRIAWLKIGLDIGNGFAERIGRDFPSPGSARTGRP